VLIEFSVLSIFTFLSYSSKITAIDTNNYELNLKSSLLVSNNIAILSIGEFIFAIFKFDDIFGIVDLNN
jgi:hypothetical protein